jgi:hypothetical protein
MSEKHAPPAIGGLKVDLQRQCNELANDVRAMALIKTSLV